MSRWLKFNAVGAAGIVVQGAVLALLVYATNLHYLVATALAVEAAVLHNFFWHRRWTWRDRNVSAVAALARFHFSNGAVSIVGNLILMKVLVGNTGIPPLAANVLSIAACSLANFILADRLVFSIRNPQSAIRNSMLG